MPAGGRSVSPRWTLTRSTGTSEPFGCAHGEERGDAVADLVVSRGDLDRSVGGKAHRRVAAAIFTGRTEAAQPRPIRQGPSRRAPGRGSRRSQPKARAPASKQAMSGREVKGLPLTGSVAVSFRRRSSIGSSPSCHAISSMALSRAKRYGTSGGARIGPGVFAIDARGPLLRSDRRAGIKTAGDVRALHGEGIEARSHDLGLVDEGGKAALRIGAEADVVARLGPVIGDGEALPPGRDQGDRAVRAASPPARRARCAATGRISSRNARRSAPRPRALAPDRAPVAPRARAARRRRSGSAHAR